MSKAYLHEGRSLRDDTVEFAVCLPRGLGVLLIDRVKYNCKTGHGGIMYFDWITWGIWLIGVIIMVIWIYVPIKEFKGIYRRHKESETN